MHESDFESYLSKIFRIYEEINMHLKNIGKWSKIIMEKVSKILMPVILELDGVNPHIIDKDAKLNKAAKRIAFRKLLNAGQTCVAANYLYKIVSLFLCGRKSTLQNIFKIMKHE